MCHSLSNSVKLNKPTTFVMYADILEKMIVAQVVTNFQISTETECSLLKLNLLAPTTVGTRINP